MTNATDILQLPDMMVQNLIDDNVCHHTKAVINTAPPDFYSNCWESNTLVRNDKTRTVFRGLLIHDKPVGIYLSIQRFKYNACDSINYQSSESIYELTMT